MRSSTTQTAHLIPALSKSAGFPELILTAVVVELKVVERLAPVHKAQLVTYLKLTGMPVGLLMNFNVPLLKQGLIESCAPTC